MAVAIVATGGQAIVSAGPSTSASSRASRRTARVPRRGEPPPPADSPRWRAGYTPRTGGGTPPPSRDQLDPEPVHAARDQVGHEARGALRLRVEHGVAAADIDHHGCTSPTRSDSDTVCCSHGRPHVRNPCRSTAGARRRSARCGTSGCGVDGDADSPGGCAVEQGEQLIAIEIGGGGDRSRGPCRAPARRDRVGDVEREVAVQRGPLGRR